MSTETTAHDARPIRPGGSALPALPPAAADALAELVAQVAATPATLPRLFAAAARRVGRGPLPAGPGQPARPGEPAGSGELAGPSGQQLHLGPAPRTVADVARIALLAAARGVLDDAALLGAVEELYRHGDADERRAVLLALPELDLGPALLPLVHDALRTNDARLVGAALGPYAHTHLDDAAWRHGVLKLLFTGIPLAAVHDLDGRTDAELVRMVTAFADERVAAGRDVPADARRLLERAARP